MDTSLSNAGGYLAAASRNLLGASHVLKKASIPLTVEERSELEYRAMEVARICSYLHTRLKWAATKKRQPSEPPVLPAAKRRRQGGLQTVMSVVLPDDDEKL